MNQTTPSERDVAVALEVLRVGNRDRDKKQATSIHELATPIASYRISIEAEKHQTNLNNVANYQLQVEEQKKCISTLEGMLSKAEKDLIGITEYWNGSPNSAVDAIETVIERANETLDAIREAKEGK